MAKLKLNPEFKKLSKEEFKKELSSRKSYGLKAKDIDELYDQLHGDDKAVSPKAEGDK